MNTHEELKAAISFLFDADAAVGVEMYFVMKPDSGDRLLKADMDPLLASALIERIVAFAKAELIDDGKVAYGPMSEADDRTHAVCRFDLGAIPDDLKFFEEAAKNGATRDYAFGKDDLSNVTGVIYRIGSATKHVALYKKHMAVNTFKRGSSLMVFPAKTRMEKLELDVLRLNGSFDLMLVDNVLIVLDVGLMEKDFKVEDLVRSKAQGKLTEIEVSGIVADMAKVREAMSDIRLARKLNKASRTSTVLRLSKSTITGFISGHRTLKDDLPFDKATHQLQIGTKAAVGEFLKLLDDDFLRSDLTNEEYEALLKKRIEKKKPTKKKQANAKS